MVGNVTPTKCWWIIKYLGVFLHSLDDEAVYVMGMLGLVVVIGRRKEAAAVG